jgi:hypothetical protein
MVIALLLAWIEAKSDAWFQQRFNSLNAPDEAAPSHKRQRMRTRVLLIVADPSLVSARDIGNRQALPTQKCAHGEHDTILANEQETPRQQGPDQAPCSAEHCPASAPDDDPGVEATKEDRWRLLARRS